MNEDQKYLNKAEFIKLLAELETDLTAFTKYLDCDRVDFFNKPYNVYPDCAYQGSLCEHSLKLYNELKKLAELYYAGKYTNKQLIKVALLKDIYRAELYEAFQKNVKNEATNQWEIQTAYRTKEYRPIFGDIQFSSYMIAKKFFEFGLDEDELVEAICFSGNNNNIEIHNIRKDYKLVVLVTMAEAAVNYLGE